MASKKSVTRKRKELWIQQMKLIKARAEGKTKTYPQAAIEAGHSPKNAARNGLAASYRFSRFSNGFQLEQPERFVVPRRAIGDKLINSYFSSGLKSPGSALNWDTNCQQNRRQYTNVKRLL